MTLGNGSPSYAVTAVSLSQGGGGCARSTLSFTTTALPLLDRIYQAEGAATAIRPLTLSVRDGAGGEPAVAHLPQVDGQRFRPEPLGAARGTATLAGRPPIAAD